MSDRKPLLRYEPQAKYIGTGDYLAEMVSDPDGECILYVDHLAERAKLFDRIAELEAMAPKWVPVAQKIALDIQGWLPLDDQKCGQGERLWLMVPPIPLPEKHEEKGSE